MKAKTITYSRLVSKGNYENEKIEICVEVEENEKAADVFMAAKKFVDSRASAAKISEYSLNNAKRVLEDRRNHTLAQIEDAELVVARAVPNDDDLPF